MSTRLHKINKAVLLLFFAILCAQVVTASDFKTQVVKFYIDSNDDIATTSAFDEVNPERTIVLISGVTQHALGAFSNATQDPNEISAEIQLTSSTELTAKRASQSSFRTWIVVLLIEYVGTAGGPNEFIVRDRRSVSWDNITDQQSYFSNSTVEEALNAVVFNSGALNYATSPSSFHHGDIASTVVKGGEVLLARANESVVGNQTPPPLSLVNSSHQLVEFVGEHWSVQKGYGTPQPHNASVGPLSGGLDENIENLSNMSTSWVYFTVMTDSSGLRERGQRVFLANTTVLRLQEHSGGTATKRISWSVIDNDHMVVQRGAADGQYLNDHSATITGFNGVTSLESAFAWVHGMTSGAGVQHPRGMWQAELVSTTSIQMERGRAGRDLDYGYYVVELPHPAALPDLSILEYRSSPPVVINDTMYVTVNVNISNVGTETLNGTFTVLSTSTEHTEESVFSGTLLPGENTSFEFTYDCGATHDMYTIIDVNDTIVEAYESNNEANVSMYCTKPDFVVEEFSQVSLTNDNGYLNATMHARITNVGGEIAAPMDVSFVGGTVVNTALPVPSLAPGASVDLLVNYECTDVHEMVVTADYLKVVTEYKESNNQWYENVTCDMPELVVGNMQFLEWDNGGTLWVNISTTINNTGGIDADWFITRIEGLNTYNLGADLSGGDSVTFYNSYPCTVSHNINATVDRDDDVEEKNESNNFSGNTVVDCVI